jgi:hypothetical protein
MTTQSPIRRTLALLVAVLTVTSVLGPVGTVAAVDGISVSQQADSTTVSPGDTITLTADVAVDGSQIDADSIGLQEDLPDGWTVTSRSPGDEFITGPDGWLWFAGSSGVDGSDTVSYTVEVPGSASAGDYTLAITASTEGGQSTTTDTTITVKDTSAGSGDTIAVNAGGGEYTANDGTVYAADQDFSGGQTFTSGASGTPSQPDIANTDDDELYWTERYGTDFSYDVPVDDGQYEVTLHFAELFQGVANDGGEGDRIFDASIEGQTVLDDYDIIAESGASQTAITETFTADVTDGELNIAFDAQGDDGEDNAKISAIEITPVGDTGSNTAPTVESIEDQSVVEGDSLTVPVTASDADGDTVSLSVDGPDFVTLANGELTIAPQDSDAGTYTVTVEADDGTDQTTESFQVAVESAGTGTTSAEVTLTLSGPAGATVELLTIEASLAPSDGYDLDAYEGDSAEVVSTQTVTLDENGEATVSVSLSESNLNYFQAAVQNGDGDTGEVSGTVVLDYDSDAGSTAQVLHRVNVGGSEIAATDGGPAWSADTSSSVSPYLATSPPDGGTIPGAQPYTVGDVDSSVPSSTPTEVFETERYDPGDSPEMQWTFSENVQSGQTYEVRLYFHDGWSGTGAVGERVFGVNVEGGDQELSSFDPIEAYGDQTGGMESFTVTAGSDDDIDVEFLHGSAENPQVNAIEIVEVSSSS